MTGKAPWTVVIAKTQENGHGQKGKSWFSPRGGLYFSVILPKAGIKDLQVITILTAFVISKVIKERFQVEPMIKLPNDVYLNGKKFCGILTENVICGEDIFSVVGIGIDTDIREFPNELADIATSIWLETGKDVDNDILLEEIIKGMQEYFKEITT
jgi:BirA family biotin operon repressor/biotin-[acetyl-CoA-carboxylase] ligase